MNRVIIETKRLSVSIIMIHKSILIPLSDLGHIIIIKVRVHAGEKKGQDRPSASPSVKP